VADAELIEAVLAGKLAGQFVRDGWQQEVVLEHVSPFGDEYSGRVVGAYQHGPLWPARADFHQSGQQAFCGFGTRSRPHHPLVEVAGEGQRCESVFGHRANFDTREGEAANRPKSSVVQWIVTDLEDESRYVPVQLGSSMVPEVRPTDPRPSTP
jgi:hypothetical protein